MQTRAALLAAPYARWAVQELDLIAPRRGEVLVHNRFAGLCHSERHLQRASTGIFPLVGGHEGSGVIEAVGPGVTDVSEGDHVVTSFVPVCGKCRYCGTGRSYLCDLGAEIATGRMFDGTFPFEAADGQRFGAFCMLGTFSEYMVVPQTAVVRIEPQIPLDVAALVACGVPTGWGSAVNAGRVRPGQVVVVFGSGGVGANAVQGAVHAGASAVIVVEPAPFRREFALKLGATHATADPGEAADWARECSQGTGADAVILTPGVLTPDIVRQGIACTAKGGRVVLAGLPDEFTDINISLNSTMLTYWCITVVGALFGQCNPHADVPGLLRRWQEGRLELEGLITHRYRLDQINDGYAAQDEGSIIRGLVDHSLS